MAPFGAQAVAHEFRESRARLKVDAPREIENGSVQNALVFVQEGAATRLVHRLWGLGVSRPDAARLISDADACSLLEATRAEELRGTADSALRIDRIRSAVRPFRPGAARVRVPDPNFRISDTTSITPLCRDEIVFDMRIRNTIAYGGMLLLNEIEPDGQVGGPAVYVMNLGDRNESLRGRFADRHWYRYELPMSRNDTLPTLVPYDSR